MYILQVLPQQAHDVRMTSYQRRCDVIASTLIWRHSDAMCPLGKLSSRYVMDMPPCTISRTTFTALLLAKILEDAIKLIQFSDFVDTTLPMSLT